MKKLLLTLAAIPFAAHAIEASAQTGYYSNVNSGGTVGVSNRIANLEARFNAGINAGVFTMAERSRISQRLAELRSLERSYSYNGLTSTERRALQTRIRALRDELRMAGGSGWARNYGWSDRDLDGMAYGSVRYDAYGRPVTNTTVAYDAYGRPLVSGGVTYDAYGRPVTTNGVVYDAYGRPVGTTGYYGQGGPYEPVPSTYNSGIGNVLGGVLGSVVGGNSGAGGLLGSILGGGGLRTGDLITSAISGVLGNALGFGNQYRDTSNVYYRTDGQRVYEIDRRTNRVLHIYPAQ